MKYAREIYDIICSWCLVLGFSFPLSMYLHEHTGFNMYMCGAIAGAAVIRVEKLLEKCGGAQ